MIESFNYLKKYIPGGDEINDNWFFSVDNEEVVKAEDLLGRKLPEQIKIFYETIGYGMLRSPHTIPQDYQFYSNNEILPPLVAAHFYQGILDHQLEPKEEALEYDDHWLSLSTLEMLKPGDLPFFEICDSSRFLIMKLDSNNSKAIWTPSNIKIEDSFKKFIWRLYYESPWFYDDIIEAHYAEAKKD